MENKIVEAAAAVRAQMVELERVQSNLSSEILNEACRQSGLTAGVEVAIHGVRMHVADYEVLMDVGAVDLLLKGQDSMECRVAVYFDADAELGTIIDPTVRGADGKKHNQFMIIKEEA